MKEPSFTAEASMLDQLDGNMLVNRIAENHIKLIHDECLKLHPKQRLYILGRVIQLIFIRHFHLMMDAPQRSLEKMEREAHGKKA